MESSDKVLFFEKPSGFSTHETESNQKNGFLEFLQEKMGSDIRLAHRLDKGTSGIMVGSADPDTLVRLNNAFKTHEVQKTYYFLTDKKPSLSKWNRTSLIQKKSNGVYESLPASEVSQEALSYTDFEVVKSVAHWSLIKAKPKSGRTHQIRLHAADSGVPILGDITYNGSPFFRLLLHAQSLESSIFGLKESELPLYFSQPEYLSDPTLCRWIEARDRRRALFPKDFASNSALRMIHSEGDPLRVDRLGNHLWGGWWSDQLPTDVDLNRFKKWVDIVSKDFKVTLSRSIQMRANREADKENSTRSWLDVPNNDWVIEENNLKFWMRPESGLSPGLFLDQRKNRERIYQRSKNKTVLNLFAYTGGFSVAAAAGGSSFVTTVDTSKSYIEWSKQNFTLNELDPSQHGFWSFDALDFLEMKAKKKETYQIIVCDPPSFGRSPRGVFKLEKDYAFLLEKISRVTSKNCEILFSCNLERWSNEEFKDRMQKAARLLKWRIKDFPVNWPDFEIDQRETLLKTVQFETL